ncbi:hypothetical protein K432DRAFT_362330 [Lepidopterella palustris CBS 459.81]|uniref:Uncharacterized protein n=1 Tax=Lepidopterella palustris CBS 459.81 TaxID=1314670 RepID=A0A8E2JAJ4_9PEZI|nr:hypothetical protein K432DRAFT_362330 [Lepidopterella palustris CBS 459.81]
MSFPTKPTFVYSGTWSAESRAHPAMKWMENYTINVIDAKKFDIPATEYHVPSFTLQKSDGTIIEGAEKAWASNKETYAPFPAHMHEPQYLFCTETENGWQMMGRANLFVELPGQPGTGEKKVKSVSGKEWDAVMPSAFHFEYVKDKDGVDGIKLAKTEIFSDPFPALRLMLKRGVIKPENILQ